MGQVQSKFIYIYVTYGLAPVCKLQVCNLILILFAQAELQKVNKHPKFNNIFDIRCQLEHFEYEMNRTKNNNKRQDTPH